LYLRRFRKELNPRDRRRAVLETTLRDGTQGEGICLSVDDKLKITAKLDTLGSNIY
jgi:isopropylmalate/homocitrate/citramalate synthase